MRILAWLAGAIGLAGLAKALRTRPQPLPESGPDPRADELRRRLEQPAEPEPEPAPVVEEPAAPRTREDVHAQARAAIAEMNASGADDGGDAGGEPARDA
jgi:hypothetical protein